MILGAAIVVAVVCCGGCDRKVDAGLGRIINNRGQG